MTDYTPDDIAEYADGRKALEEFSVRLTRLIYVWAATREPISATKVYDDIERHLDDIFGPLWRPERSVP